MFVPKSRLAALAAVSVIAVAVAGASSGMAENIEFTVNAGKHDRINTPITVTVMLPDAQKDVTEAIVLGDDGKVLHGQLTQPRLLSDAAEAPSGKVQRELHFLLPELKAGQTQTFELATGQPASTKPSEKFAWHDTPGEFTDLTYGNRPVLRYMYKPLNTSSKESREATFKVYHHVFDRGGKQLLTKGPGGLFPHHRGLFYGFNRISYGDNKQADVWHGRFRESQSHEGVLSEEAGPVLGRHRVKIDWHGRDGDVFAQEERELTVYEVPGNPGATLIEVASRLRPTSGPVRLDGDPQHSGFQFRASQEVPDKTKDQTYYVRPDGVGKPGDYQNWDAKKRDPRTVNLPWKGMSFVLGDQRYTVANLDHPANPKEARFSERDYGRFGSYFEYDLTAEKPLEIRYRYWVQPGEMTVEQIERLAADFVAPPQATVTSASVAADNASASSAGDNTPPEGFTALFNGKDLTGWKGLVANPKERAKMTTEQLVAAQEQADQKMRDHWHVVDGVLVFDGKGDNLCTAKDYGDFELFVDWKIEPAGDSGIYLRGTPQVQIWDTKHEPAFQHGANKGSGGLWNNQQHERFPLVHADKPVGQWNTMRIRMVGDKVTVWLNGQLVTDNVTMENYWQRDKPMYPTGAIELQNHGNTLYFKNIYVKKL